VAPTRVWPTVLLSAAVAAGLTWLAMRGSAGADSATGSSSASTGGRNATDPASASPRPRSAADLRLDPRTNVVSAPAELRKAMVVQEGVRVINELKAANPETFDASAKRWIETPRVKELIKEWQALEAGWKDASEEAREARLPDARAMWEEAMTLLRAEVARDAGGVRPAR